MSGSCTTTKLSSCIIGAHKPILPQVTAAEHGVSPDRLNRKTRKTHHMPPSASQRGSDITTRCQHGKEKLC